MKLEINKIVTLGNNEQYLIVDSITKDGNAIVDVSTGEIITIDNSYVISTMNFGVYVLN